MRVLALVLVAAMLAPAAAAKSPEPSYREQAEGLLGALAKSVHAARTATVAHAVGELTSRQTAHVMRVEAERVESIALQAGGLEPPAPLRRAQEAFALAADGYAVALRSLERCYRGSDVACERGASEIDAAESYRERAFS